MTLKRQLRVKLRKLTRPFRHQLLSSFLVGLSWLAHRLPLKVNQFIGVRLALFIRLILPRQRALIMNQLQQVAGELGYHQDELIVIEKLHWRDLGQRLGEWLSGEQALDLFWASAETLSKIDQAYQQGRRESGLVVCTAHYGHWELMAAWLHRQGYSFLAVASAPPRGPFGAWLTQYRSQFGVKVIHPQGGAKRARSHLKAGGVVAFLIDHSTSEKTQLYPFLGCLAPHSLTVDRIINKSGALALWICSQRHHDGRYEVFATQLNMLVDSTSRHEQDHSGQHIAHYSLQAHQHLAHLMMQAPEQWLWLHQRWSPRKTPKSSFITTQLDGSSTSLKQIE